MEIAIGILSLFIAALGVHYARKSISGRQSSSNRTHAATLPTPMLSESPALARRPLLRRRLDTLIRRHFYYADERIDAGTFESVHLQLYVDLMEATVNPDELKVLAKSMSLFVKKVIAYPFDIVATPKNGNPLLGYEVARRLGKQFLIVKDFGPRRSYKFDGKFQEGDTAILIDDVSADGLFLSKPATMITEHGMKLRDCLVLIHRQEGSADERLREEGYNLHALLTLSDADIAAMLGISHIDSSRKDAPTGPLTPRS